MALMSSDRATVKAKLLAALLTVQLCPIINAFKCPDDYAGECSCDLSDSKGSKLDLRCHNLSSQQQLTDLMTAVTEANLDIVLKISSIIISKALPSLTTLDLSPLKNCEIDGFQISKSPNLRSIVKATEPNQMTVKIVRVIGTMLSNQDAGNLLSYIDPTSDMDDIILERNNLKKVERGSQLIPNLGAFTTVDSIELSDNNIEELSEGAFKGLPALKFLHLDKNNIKRIEKGAFQFDLKGDKGMLVIFLEDNKLETLPKESFTDFLSHKKLDVIVRVSRNQFVCNDTMKWIKSIKLVGKFAVTGADCENDPGQTIYTTSLVGDPDEVSTARPGSSGQSFSGLYFVILLHETISLLFSGFGPFCDLWKSSKLTNV